MRFFYILSLIFASLGSTAQNPQPDGTADILLSLKKLENTASVLYIAAHPDDENTRLLAYLANERCVRTGYLSLTRGDGGQNLIGDEQGIELGMIRTQELLSARRIDGAEQFFSRAFDFGYSKSPEETLEIWGHQKILADVVWVIRKFRPDVVITRFPTTGEGGHGHHTASAILAVEAVKAAADPEQFKEQFDFGVKPWAVTRLFWNTFRFGSTNTLSEDQLKIDVGGFNPLLGLSYGEIAAKSRSQHKSQGFGVPAQRGSILEYFKQLSGPEAKTDILENVESDWGRYQLGALDTLIHGVISMFNPNRPYLSVPALLQIREKLEGADVEAAVKALKLNRIDQVLSAAAGLYFEVTSSQQVNVVGDTAHFTLFINSASIPQIKQVSVSIGDSIWRFENFLLNKPQQKQVSLIAPENWRTQPYWLKEPMDPGAFNIPLQTDIGLPQKPLPVASWKITWEDGSQSAVSMPVQFKHTDPVKGELYEPIVFTGALSAQIQPSVLLANREQLLEKKVEVEITSWGRDTLRNLAVKFGGKIHQLNFDQGIPLGGKRTFLLPVGKSEITDQNGGSLPLLNQTDTPVQQLRKISYDHIPDIFYHSESKLKLVRTAFKISGKRIGYIPGAGDKVAEGLKQMGYLVDVLSEHDIRQGNLGIYDAIVTGVRAYNVNNWLADVYPKLMQFVFHGGVMLVQYNTNNNLGALKEKIGPYSFEISRSRITNEHAEVNFVRPEDPLLHYPNVITSSDFTGWIQERSIYEAGERNAHYRTLFSMNDPNEKPIDGSLIATDYGKGRFIYTGLVFFREIPAGVPGAYRLLANLLSKPRVNRK